MSRYHLGFGARLPRASVALIALALGLLAGPASAGTYTVIDLATLDEGATVVVRGVNGGGTAVGGGRVGGARRGLLFTPGGLQAVDGVAGSDYSIVFDINDHGAVIGGSNATTAARGFLRTAAGALRELAPLPGVAGQGSRARALNDRGDVVGAANGGAGLRAVVWRGGGPALQLGALPGRATSEAIAVNARGDIVGYSSDATGARRATLWSTGGAIVDLGALPGGEFSQALGINNAGHIVGTSMSSLGSRACLWTPRDGLQDLNALVAPSSSVLTHATGINRAGVIVAFGHEAVSHDADDGHDGHGHDDTHELPVRVFLLVPFGARP